MSHRRHLADDLWLPDPETTKTVQAGANPLPFEENDCNLHVLSQRAIETLMVRKVIPAEVAPTVLIPAVQESEAVTGDLEPPPVRKTSTIPFVLLLLAISLVSVLMGVLIAPLIVS